MNWSRTRHDGNPHGWPISSVRLKVEQDELLAYVDVQTHTLNTTISRLHREIELLREYRTRLVADVVTGKLDVRKAAAQLPTIGAESPIEPDSADVEEASDELVEDEA